MSDNPWRSPRRLADAMLRLLKETQPERKLASTGVVDALARVVGPEAAAHVRAAGLRAGVLTVEVDSSAWMQELEFDRARILKGIKADPEAPRVIRLKFKVGNKKR